MHHCPYPLYVNGALQIIIIIIINNNNNIWYFGLPFHLDWRSA